MCQPDAAPIAGFAGACNVRKMQAAARPYGMTHRISVIIPCLDEEEAIGAVVRAVLHHHVSEVIVVDGGSKDRTAQVAREAGAFVVRQARRGYGCALSTGVAAASRSEILLFLDGDGSDRPEMIPSLLAPIINNEADFVLGSRLRGEREPGSLSIPQIVAGHVAGWAIRLAYGVRFTDMSPFRAIRRSSFDRLGMKEETFGWNLEMQMRAAAAGLRILEIPVGQRRRAGGVSKVSGNPVISLRAAWNLAGTFLRLAGTLRRESQASRR
jgi:glycosyltransferase involved in cell wall biosynthesis